VSEPDPPAGWYPNPAEGERLRWWDGERWTDETRGSEAPVTRAERRAAARHAAPWPRERRVAAGAVAALLLASVGVWIAAVIAGRDAPDDVVAVGDTPQEPADEPSTPQDDPADDGEEPEENADEQGEPDDEADQDPIVLDFDGRCEVEVDPAETDDPASLRPWDFPECDRAPIALDDTEGRWIVVVASLNGDEVEESEAIGRSQGSDQGLLWSSHYPSLNPGLWVLYEGPFRDEEAATEAAESIGSGAYPRLVSDDDNDRYCIAADGCVGGSGD